MRRFFIVALTAICLAAAAPVSSADLASNWKQCRDRTANDDARIEACSAVIGSRKEQGVGLAEAYSNRCSAYDFRSDRTAVRTKTEQEADQTRAMQDCNRAIALKPDTVDAYVTRGLMRKAGKDRSGAIDDFSHAIALKLDDLFAFTMRGDAYAEMGDYDRAIADCSHALKKGFVIGGFARYCIDRANTAKTQLAAGQKLGDPRAWCNGEALAQEGFPADKQIEGCTRLINSGTESRAALVKDYFNRASAHEFTDFAKAIDDYKAVVRLKPDYADAYGGLAISYWLDKQYALAIPAFDKAIALKGSRPDMYYPDRGQAHAALGQYAPAIADFTSAIALDPTTDNFAWRSFAYTGAGDTARAIADADQAIKASAHYGGVTAAYDARGSAHFHMGDFAAAIADFEGSLEIWPQDPRALYGRGAAKSRKGDKKGGEDDMKAAIQLTADIAATESHEGIAP